MSLFLLNSLLLSINTIYKFLLYQIFYEYLTNILKFLKYEQQKQNFEINFKITKVKKSYVNRRIAFLRI